MENENDWVKQVLVGVAVLLGVAALVGGLIGFVSLKAADFAGITSDPTSSRETMVLGPRSPTPPTTAPHTPRTSTTTPPPRPSRTGIVLHAAPSSAAAYDKITLTGTCRVPACTTLQVQRKEAGTWVDFPTQTTVNDGRFSTYIQTGHTGINLFRVQEISSGRASLPVRVTIG